MNRRLVVSIAMAQLAARAAVLHAQPARAVLPRIGVLSFGHPPSGPEPDPITGFRRGMRDLGHDDGRNIVLDLRYAEGRPDLLAANVAAFVRSNVDVILAGGPLPLQFARQATRTVPIVAISGSDPVREGWAQTLARPGGNVTGVQVTFLGLAAKQLEILQGAVPALERVAVMVAPAELDDPGVEAGARALGLQLTLLEVRGPDDFERAFETAAARRAQGLYAIATNTVVAHRTRLARLAIEHRLPSISELTLLADAGFLLSYGADLEALGRRAATYVDKILKGARAGELAIELPAVFEFVVNRKTAAALGMAMPQSLWMRATRLIE
ncbi:ABC transporter substrate-binding protein [Variovorax sp. J31P179]|uniref:ABC transporter substrate-binding protein n=1 Tax=Variovorax sp. J31P179 TaxID=3053508 RepID=UPI002574AA28|nr:ABC transporter substrate-binding protein [Variovorax sp. J31P179]MDM0079536.1 ABC transporter substrate-binding protein [Variovorax sp. J31P179]